MERMKLNHYESASVCETINFAPAASGFDCCLKEESTRKSEGRLHIRNLVKYAEADGDYLGVVLSSNFQ